MARVRRVQVRHSQTCPLCREGLWETARDELAVCGGCATVAHLGCVHELGGGACPTPGCGRPLTRERVQVPRAEARRVVAKEQVRELTLAQRAERVVYVTLLSLLMLPLAAIMFGLTGILLVRGERQIALLTLGGGVLALVTYLGLLRGGPAASA